MTYSPEHLNDEAWNQMEVAYRAKKAGKRVTVALRDTWGGLIRDEVGDDHHWSTANTYAIHEPEPVKVTDGEG